MKTMMIVQNDLIEWMKTCALFNFKIDTIIKFIWQNVISRHECFDVVILNEDSENKKIIKQLLQRYRVKVKIVSSYHSMINDMIERDHQSIVDALSKLIDDKSETWSQHLHAIYVWKFDIFYIMLVFNRFSFLINAADDRLKCKRI